jgi:protease-4
VDAILQAGVEDTYGDFLKLVAEARGITPAQVDAVGQGRVWDGGTARQKKLVDQFGGLGDALAWVADEADLEDGAWHPRYLAEPLDGPQALLAQILRSGDAGAGSGAWAKTEGNVQTGGDLFAIAAQNRDRTLARLMADARRLSGRTGMQAYCLECPAELAPVALPRYSRETLSAWARLRALLD